MITNHVNTVELVRTVIIKTDEFIISIELLKLLELVLSIDICGMFEDEMNHVGSGEDSLVSFSPLNGRTLCSYIYCVCTCVQHSSFALTTQQHYQLLTNTLSNVEL